VSAEEQKGKTADRDQTADGISLPQAVRELSWPLVLKTVGKN
jgi:hypothetical protein